MLILVMAACLAAIIITIICKVAAVPALLVTVMALAAFAGVLITSTIISFRQGAAVRPRQGVALGRLTRGKVRPYRGDGIDADGEYDQADVYALDNLGGRVRPRLTRDRGTDPGGGQLSG